MPQTLIDQGISLMLYGMGTVFLFLTVLVLATTVMSQLVRSRSSSDGQPPAATRVGNDSQPDGQLIRAIEKAIAQHRKR